MPAVGVMPECEPLLPACYTDDADEGMATQQRVGTVNRPGVADTHGDSASSAVVWALVFYEMIGPCTRF